MSQTGYIYSIENTLNDEIYIGCTLRSINDRFTEHVLAARKRPLCLFHEFMNFHGPENFFVTELKKIENTSMLELQTLEESYIKDFGSLNTINSHNNVPKIHDRTGIVLHKRKIVDKKRIRRTNQEYLDIALELFPKFLKFEEFINLFMDEEDNYDKILGNYETNKLIHLSTPLIKCLGYEGEIRSQQQAMKKFLKSNGVNIVEINSNDNKLINNYPSIIEELSAITNKGAIAKKKWLLIEPREFKKIIMKLNTKNGNKIREYYVSLEEFIKLYFEYSLRFKERESQLELQQAKLEIEDLKKLMMKMKLDSISQYENVEKQAKERHEELMLANEDLQVGIEDIQERLDIAVEDRSPKIESIPQRERFIVLKKNISISSGYYVMRGQDSYIHQKLISHKVRYPKMSIVLDILCQPNPRNLFIRFRELKDERFGIRGNNITTNYEEKMIEIFKLLNDEKRNI